MATSATPLPRDHQLRTVLPLDHLQDPTTPEQSVDLYSWGVKSTQRVRGTHRSVRSMILHCGREGYP
ncbi:hypothetical protein GCM10011410_16500 [Hoyosella rhizosphaerae]|uniref:Uncharacterized protein n=1 Tax=Hoyosella rhizosphaerae TaxID=1755582 RepID=A0A916UA11_9ACTN|nr:hypothetical protein GCM10011410_16500 [Hoyosella rhizosphaerae]